MITRAVRELMVRPITTAVLSGGFGGDVTLGSAMVFDDRSEKIGVLQRADGSDVGVGQ
jgi:hypothetical protein